MDKNADNQKDHATRLVCAELYKGGLLAANSILNDIHQRPFTAKNPEVGIDINLVAKHAEKAFQYHLKFALLAAGLTFLGLIFFLFSEVLSGVIIAAVVALITWKALYLNRNIALENFSKKSYNPDYQIEEILPEGAVTEQGEGKSQNVIIFGGYFPFLGAGYRIGNWNFVIDTSKPAKSSNSESPQPKDITIDEAYNAVSEEIGKKNLPNVSDEYILFADGKELKESFLLPTRIGEPIDNLDIGVLRSEGHKSLYEEYRAYYSTKYFDKMRGTLFSTFLRFSKVGKEIFTECSFYVLPPIDEDKYKIDKLPLYDERFSLKMGIITAAVAILSFIMAIPVLFLIPFVTFGPLLIIANGWYKRYNIDMTLKGKIKKGEPHNYGNLKTFREAKASPNYKNYFGAQDIIMIQNSIEQTIIYSIADLLDKKGIDSSFLREDLLAFVNQGIMMYGGELKAEQVAVGKGAQATMKQARKSTKKVMRFVERGAKQGGSTQ